MSGPKPAPIAPRLLAWFERHGRKDLPWQHTPTPYRVWVSEIMLQQTQVATVIPYFERFVARFPDVDALAAAPLDEVLHHWTGLGYYARARNLHRAAAIVVEHHGGALPDDVDTLQSLPGIGRSTAGAIRALAAGARHPILDGNVKRVLCRHHAIGEWPGVPAVTRRLWALAESHLPRRRIAAYTQALMDLGATLCTRARPDCAACPIAADCAARARGLTASIPAPQPRRALPVRAARVLVVRDRRGRVLLERRPPAGVWGGLWSFPECPPGSEPAAWCRERLGCEASALEPLAGFRHSFTHFHLDLEPVLVCVAGAPRAARGRVMEGPDRLWYNEADPPRLGLAAPVARVLESLRAGEIATR